MRKRNILSLGLLGFVFGVGCHKAVPVASAPPSPAPVTAPARLAEMPSRASAPAPNSRQAPAAAPTRSQAMPPEVRAKLSDRLARLEDALFDFDKSTIRSDAAAALKDDVSVIREILVEYPSQKLQIEGHCDERGSDEYNMALGDRRSHAAEEFLTNMGIPKAQLTVISYGKERPVCTEQTESCYQKNRRAHIIAAR
jgi:peptidoglycan-associated lipoprotein